MSEPRKTAAEKRPWEKPAMKPVGTVADTLKAGGGKLSPFAADTGDDRKPKGQG